MNIGGTTPGPVNSSENSNSLRKTDTCTSLDNPEIDMTSILGSLPACFLEAYQWGWGGESGLVLLPCRPNFRWRFQKKMMALLMFVVFQQLTWEKSQNKYTKICLSRGGDESMSHWMLQLWISLQRAWTSIRMLGYWHEIQANPLSETGNTRLSLKVCPGTLSQALEVAVLHSILIFILKNPPCDLGVDRLEAWLKDWVRAIDDEAQDTKHTAGRQIKIGEKGSQMLTLSQKQASDSIFSRSILNWLKVRGESGGDKNLPVTKGATKTTKKERKKHTSLVPLAH